MLKIMKKENFDEIVNSNHIVLIDFYATWCGPCKMLSPIIEEIANENLESVQVCKVNVDEESDLSNKFGITSIPTLIVIKDGKAERQAMGYRTKESILRMIDFK